MDRPAQDYDSVWSSGKNGLLGLQRRRLPLSLIVVSVGVVLSFLFSRLLVRQEERLAEAQFRYDAARRVDTIQRAITDRLGDLNTLAAYYAGSEVVERKEFHTFVKPLLENPQGIVALGWAPHILTGQRQAHEQFARSERVTNYQITKRDEHGRFVPAGRRAEYWPILFIEPARENKKFLGYDIDSNPTYRKALRRTTITGQPTAGVCDPIETDKEGNPLVYVLMPAKNDTSGREKRPPDQPGFDGFVFGLFDIKAVVESALNPTPVIGIDVSIIAPSSLGGKDFVYWRPARLRTRPGTTLADRTQADIRFPSEIVIADSRWKIECIPVQSYLERYRTWGPVGVLLCGLLATGLLVAYLLSLTGRTARVERLVAQRTRELHESEQRFRRLVDNAGDTFVLRTQEGKILDVNKHACESLGYSREELLSMTIADIDPDFARQNVERYSKLPPDAYPVSFEGAQRRRDGTRFPVEIRLTMLYADGQRLMLGLVRDISERRRLEQMLREGERKLSAILDQTFQFIGLLTPDGIMVEANKSALEFAGVTAAAVLNMPFWDTPWWSHSPELQQRLREAVKKAAQGEFVRMEVTHRAANGELHWIDFSLKPVKDETGKVVFLIPEGRDVTERKQVEEALNDERRLLRTMLDMHERERKLIAYEIHDGLAQQLVGAVYRFQSIEALRDRDPDAALELFDEALRLLREAMAETRRLISGLRPPILEDAGVVDALDYLITEQRQRGCPEIEFVHPDQFERLAPLLKSAIFRIVQECLTNACRYSQSQKIRIELGRSGDRVQVEVCDWGIGFDPAQVGSGHYGLQGIRQRAQVLGGSATIDAAPGRGTRVRVDLPLLHAENGAKAN
jgi:PAS domain S-box-containing protein